jgi:hypothetical protein
MGIKSPPSWGTGCDTSEDAFRHSTTERGASLVQSWPTRWIDGRVNKSSLDIVAGLNRMLDHEFIEFLAGMFLSARGP